MTGERNPAYACDAMRPRVVKRRLLRACDKTRYRGSSWQVLLVGSMVGGHAGSIRCIPLPSGFRGRTRERSPGWLLLLARAAALQMAHAPEGFVRREMDAMIHWRHCGELPRTVVMPVRRTDTYVCASHRRLWDGRGCESWKDVHRGTWQRLSNAASGPIRTCTSITSSMVN